jgi:glycosyltransferase involved in cell wall biosynthesis
MTTHRTRVMYVVPDLAVGGAERHVTTLLPNMDPARFETAVVCLGAEGALFGDLAGTATRAVALGRSKRQAPSALYRLVREMRAYAPDVVITRGYSAEILGRVAAWLTRVPVQVVWVHNYGDTQERGAIRRVADRVLARVTTAYFGVADAQTDYLADDLGIDRSKIRIIHNGVDPADFDRTEAVRAPSGVNVEAGEKVVAIVAALRPEKDHQTFVRAARLVADRVPNAKFLIIGDGPMRPEVERVVRDLDLGDRTILTGARSDVPDLLGVVDAFVLSSFSVECFPMALLEAMAARTPAVCTAVGGVPEIIENGVTGFLVPPKNPAALADRLVDVLSDDDLAARLGAAGRARVETEFSLRTSVTATERAIDDLVGAQSVPDRPIRLTVVLDEAHVGGVEVLLLNLFKHLDPRVVMPRLVCLREAGSIADEFRSAGFDVESLCRSGRFDTSTLPRLIRSLRRDGTDAVLVTHHHRASLALGRIAALLARVPANVVAVHDMDLVSLGQRVLPRWAVGSLAASDAMVLLSEGQRTYLHTQEGVGRHLTCSTREVVIHNGIVVNHPPNDVDVTRARRLLGVSPGDFVVGIVARLAHQKAHEVLFHAVAACTEAGVTNLRLVVIGTGDRQDELRKLAAELGIYDRTRFLGLRRDVEALLPGLDVACLSSVHEGVPITLIEAMAAGVAIVATDTGSVAELVRDGIDGFVVPVGDTSAFAQRLQLLADDGDMRTRMGRSGRARVESDFRIEGTARGYEELLVNLTRGEK